MTRVGLKYVTIRLATLRFPKTVSAVAGVPALVGVQADAGVPPVAGVITVAIIDFAAC